MRPTWLDPRLEVRESPLHGWGAYATAPIRESEIVTIWAHGILDAGEAAQVQGGELHRRGDGRYVWYPASGYDPAEDLLDHSCDPNVWMSDKVTLAARRDIGAVEELAGDYALWELDLAHVCPFKCRFEFDVIPSEELSAALRSVVQDETP